MEGKLSPFQLAQTVYETEQCSRTFKEDLQLHLENGYVFSTPDVFMMARPVERDAPYEFVTDPEHKFKTPDAWLVYLASGHPGEIFKYEPYPLPWIGFERENELRFHNRNRIQSLCSYLLNRKGRLSCCAQ